MAEEETSMRKKRSVIALAVCLVLLVGAYAVLRLTNPPDDGTDPGKTNESIDISRFDRANIIRMTLVNENGEFVFEKKEIKDDEDKDEEGKDKETRTEWVCIKPYDTDLSQSSVEDLARTFSALAADVLVEEEPEDLSIYGLADPAARAEALLKDGKKVVLLLGNYTASGTYYLMKEGDSRVFTVLKYHGDRLKYAFSDFRNKTLASIELSDLQYMYISKEGQKDIEIITKDEQEEDEPAYGLGIYSLVKPFKIPRGIDMSKLSNEFAKAASLRVQEFVDDDPDDLSKYGLDKPKMRFILKDSANTLDIYFGDTVDDSIYVKKADSDSVYKLALSDISFMDAKLIDYMERFAFIVNIDNVDKVVVEGRGKTYTLSMKRETKKANDEDEKDEVVTTYFLDGVEKPEEMFKDAYQALIAVLVDATRESRAEGEPEIRFTYYLNKGAERVQVVEFYPYDKDFYALVRNGDLDSEFLVGRNRLDSVYTHIENLEKSKLED